MVNPGSVSIFRATKLMKTKGAYSMESKQNKNEKKTIKNPNQPKMDSEAVASLVQDLSLLYQKMHESHDKE